MLADYGDKSGAVGVLDNEADADDPTCRHHLQVDNKVDSLTMES
jgi:hypothetical protein